MPQYNLTQTQLEIVTSWLFEASGYLDVAVNNLGISARAALILDPILDVANWIRINIKGSSTAQSDWEECGMVWWIRANDAVNITPPTRPPEAAAWVTKLQEWDASINAGFNRVPQSQRDSSTVPITAEDGSISTMPAGSNLSQQQQIITKVIGVLA